MKTGNCKVQVLFVSFGLLAGLSGGAEPVGTRPMSFAYRVTFSSPVTYVTLLEPDGAGGFYCGGEGAGLWHFDGLWWHRMALPGRFEYPLSAARGRDGEVAFGLSRSGVFVQGKDGERQWHNFWNGLGGERVLAALFQQVKGRQILWLGTDQGLWRFLNNRWQRIASAKHGMTRMQVTCLAVWDDALIAGTDSAGVWKVVKGKLHPLGTSELAGANILEMAVDQEERLWAATLQGLSVLEKGQELWKRVKVPLRKRSAAERKLALSPISQAVRALAVDGQGRLWLGTRAEGIFVRTADGKQWWRMGAKEGLPDVFVRSVICSAKGSVIAGTYGKGVTVFEPEKKQFAGAGLVLDCAGSKVTSNRGWTYEEEKAPEKGEKSASTERSWLCKAQADGNGRFVALYFRNSGPGSSSSRPGAPAQQGKVVLLEAGSGKKVWELPGLPLRPVRWNEDGTWIAVVRKKGEIELFSRPASAPVAVKSPRGMKDFYFTGKEVLVTTRWSGSLQEWRLGQGGAKPMSSNAKIEDPSPLQELKWEGKPFRKAPEQEEEKKKTN